MELRMPPSWCYLAAIPTTALQTLLQSAVASCHLQTATTATAFRRSSAGIPAQVLVVADRRGSPRAPDPIESFASARPGPDTGDPALLTALRWMTRRPAGTPERSSGVESALPSSWLQANAGSRAAACSSYALRPWTPA